MSRFNSFSNNTQGILFMILAIFSLSIMDVIAKTLASEIHIFQILWARSTGQTLIVAAIVLPRLRKVLKTNYPKLQLLRSALILMIAGSFFFAIKNIGLAEATAIMDLSPVLITLGAALVLGEKFGPRRAFGVGAALVGALIIIRPGTEVFSPYAIFALLAAFGYAGYAIATRFVGRDESIWTSLLYSGLLGAVVLLGIVPFFWTTPTLWTAMLMLLIGVFGACGQMLMIRALMKAEAGVVAPFSYVGLLFATAWGALFFAEFPDRATYLGALVIVGAGIYVWHRETRTIRKAVSA